VASADAIMPRARACPSCGQMVLIGGFTFHVKQCGRKQKQVETPCPYCDKMYPQFELASHVGSCMQNPNRSRTNAREYRKANRRSINGRGRGGGGLGEKVRQEPQHSNGEAAHLDSMGVKELKQYIASAGLDCSGCIEKADLLARAREAGSGAGGNQGKVHTRRGAPSLQAPEEFPGSGTTMGLVPCGHCGRSFAPDRIGRHMDICAKTKSKRRTFDSASQRARGQEIFTRVTPPQPVKGGKAASGAKGGNRHARVDFGLPSEAKLRSKWRQEHREFQNVIRSIRGKAPLRSEYAYPGGGGGDYHPEPEPSSGPSHFVPCPHCARTFDPTVAARHIPSCEKTFARAKPPPAMRGSVVAGAGGRRAGWNSGPGGTNSGQVGSGRRKPASATRRHRASTEVTRQMGGPMMGGRSSRFPPSGTGGNVSAAFAHAGARAMYGLGAGNTGMRPSSGGGFMARPASGGSGFRPNQTTGSFSSMRADRAGGLTGGPVKDGGPGFVPMLSSTSSLRSRHNPASRWPSVYQQ
jgi:hypothetical protein